MATIDELERLDREIKEAEHEAIHNLAEYLRDAVRDLPSQSKLALAFVCYARTLDTYNSGGTTAATIAFGFTGRKPGCGHGLLGEIGDIWSERDDYEDADGEED